MGVPLQAKLLNLIIVKLSSLYMRKDGTVNRRILTMAESRVKPNEKPVKGVATKDITIDKETNVWVRVFLPSSAALVEKVPVWFHFHGGAFALLSADDVQVDAFCRRLARRTQAVVISVNYRRSPEHPYPAAYDDCFLALKWLQSEVVEPGKGKWLPDNVDVSQCYFIGESAGGNIAHHLGVRAAGCDLSPVAIARIVLVQPWFNSEERLSSFSRIKKPIIVTVKGSDFFWRAFLPKGADRDHPACNIFGPNSPSLVEVPLPKTLVVVGGLDPLEDWQTLYVERLKELGKEVKLVYYEQAIHGFSFFKAFKEARLVLEEINSFVHD